MNKYLWSTGKKDYGKRAFKSLFLSLHLCGTIHQFYEIIVNEDEGYEILFRKIQCALTATVSLLSLFLYLWYSDLIRSTLLKLQNIDYALKSIAVKGCRQRSIRAPLHVSVYVVLIALHCYMRYLRGGHFYASVHFVVILKDSFLRSYFIAVNGFITLNFASSIAEGKDRFARLNRHINKQVSVELSTAQLSRANEV